METLQNKTLDELKVLAYDEGMRMEQARINLTVINQEIGKRIQDEEKKKEK
jgi:hypothetical protein